MTESDDTDRYDGPHDGLREQSDKELALALADAITEARDARTRLDASLLNEDAADSEATEDLDVAAERLQAIAREAYLRTAPRHVHPEGGDYPTVECPDCGHAHTAARRRYCKLCEYEYGLAFGDPDRNGESGGESVSGCRGP